MDNGELTYEIVEKAVDKMKIANEKPNTNGSVVIEFNILQHLIDTIDSQKAEIEKWQGGYMTQKQEIANLEIQLKAMRGAANSYKAEFERLKAEAIKGYVEKLKERKYQSSDWSHGVHPYVVEEDDIDDVFKEMVGSNDD